MSIGRQPVNSRTKPARWVRQRVVTDAVQRWFWGITRSEREIASSMAVKEEALVWARRASHSNGFSAF